MIIKCRQFLALIGDQSQSNRVFQLNSNFSFGLEGEMSYQHTLQKLSQDKTPRTQAVRDIGLVIDSKLLCDKHCPKNARNLSQFVNFIFRNLELRDFDLLMKMYKCRLLHLFGYCCPLNFFPTLQDVELAESFQKYFAKRICGSQLSHLKSPERLKHFNLEFQI